MVKKADLFDMDIPLVISFILWKYKIFGGVLPIMIEEERDESTEKTQINLQSSNACGVRCGSVVL